MLMDLRAHLIEKRNLVAHLVEGGRRAGERDRRAPVPQRCQPCRDFFVVPLPMDLRAHLVEEHDLAAHLVKGDRRAGERNWRAHVPQRRPPSQ